MHLKMCEYSIQQGLAKIFSNQPLSKPTRSASTHRFVPDAALRAGRVGRESYKSVRGKRSSSQLPVAERRATSCRPSCTRVIPQWCLPRQVGRHRLIFLPQGIKVAGPLQGLHRFSRSSVKAPQRTFGFYVTSSLSETCGKF